MISKRLKRLVVELSYRRYLYKATGRDDSMMALIRAKAQHDYYLKQHTERLNRRGVGKDAA